MNVEFDVYIWAKICKLAEQKKMTPQQLVGVFLDSRVATTRTEKPSASHKKTA